MVGWQKTCLSHRCLGYTTVLVQSLICLLVIYSLIIEGGTILIDGCKKIGFYDYCLRNTTGDDCHCLTKFNDLQSKTTASGLSYALFMTYASLVVVIMGLVILMLTQYLQDEVLTNFNLAINILSLVGFFNGISNHLYLVWDEFDFSHVTPGFLALLLAIGGLSLQSCLIYRYIKRSTVLLTPETRDTPLRTFP